jgi:hypothetical protein
MSKSELTQLPTRASTHRFQDESRRRFGELFSDPYFICRQETDNDYGVDCIIEALVDDGESASNMRTHVQLKSTSSELNSEGSLSYSVAASNLNYLLNVSNSLYAIHHQPSGEIYWKFARDVYLEATKSGKDWDEKTVTVRSSQILDQQEVKAIHAAVVEYGRETRATRLGARPNAALLTADPREQGAQDRLARERIDFRGERQRHKFGFFGRDALLDELDDAIADTSVDWLLLTGGWGLGKSALLNAWLARREAAGVFTAVHFIRANVSSWDDPDAIRRNLSAQIEQQYRTHQHPWPDDPDRLRAVLTNVGDALAPRGQRLMVLIDGLDEALALSKPATLLSSFLPHAQLRGVVFVVSSRPHPQILDWFRQRTDDRIHHIDLDTRARANSRAVAEFWHHQQATTLADSLSDEQIDGLIESSEGNFLHAIQAFKDATGSGVVRAADHPRGLRGFLESLWSDLSRIPTSDQRPVLEGLLVLCLGKRALPLSVLEQLVPDWPMFGRERLLEAAGNFLLGEREHYRPSHEAVREFVIERCGAMIDPSLRRLTVWARWPVPEPGSTRWRYALAHGLDHVLELGDIDAAVETCLNVAYLDEAFMYRGLEAVERELRRVMALTEGPAHETLRDVLLIIECGHEWLVGRRVRGVLRALLYSQALNLWGSADAVVKRLTWDLLPRLRPRTPVPKHAMVMQLFGHRSGVAKVATLGDGRLASASNDGELFVWDLLRHRPERRFRISVEPYTEFELTPANDHDVLIISKTGRVQMIDCDTGEVRVDVQAGATKASAMGEQIFALVEGKLEQCWPPGHEVSGVEQLTMLSALATIGDRLALGAADGTLHIWDGRSPLVALSGHDAHISQLVAAGEKLVSLSQEGTVGVWSLRPARLLRKIETGAAYRVSASPDGTTLFAQLFEDGLRAWSLDSGAPLGFIHSRSFPLSMAAIDSRRVAAPSLAYIAVNIDHLLLESPTHATPPGGGDPWRKHVLLADGTLISGQGAELERLNIATGEGKTLCTFADTPQIYDLCAVEDRLFVAGGEGVVGLLDLDGGEQEILTRIECEYPDDEFQFEDATNIAASPRGVVVVASSGRGFQILDLRDRSEHTLILDEDGWQTEDIIHLHDDVFAVIDERAFVRVIDVIAGEYEEFDIRDTLAVSHLAGGSLAKLADGRIACGLSNGLILLWDHETGTQTLQIQHWGPITDIFPLACGGFWAASGDGSVGRWTAEGECLATSYAGAAVLSVVEVDGEIVVRDRLSNTWLLDFDPPAKS